MVQRYISTSRCCYSFPQTKGVASFDKVNLSYLNSGCISVLKGSIDRCTSGKSVTIKGENIKCDLLIQAVGWKLGVPYLLAGFQKKLIEEDGQYRVFRFSVPPNLPDTGFAGFNSNFCTVLSAEMIANRLVYFADGKLAQQPDRTEMETKIKMMLDWRRQNRPAAKVYGGLCSAPFHFKHFDELLTDMGASKKQRTNPLAE